VEGNSKFIGGMISGAEDAASREAEVNTECPTLRIALKLAVWLQGGQSLAKRANRVIGCGAWSRELVPEHTREKITKLDVRIDHLVCIELSRSD
jgi:hypothetical protein